MRSSLLILTLLVASSCASVKPSAESGRVDSVRASTPYIPRIAFGYSAGGYSTRPSDAIRLDTTQQMTITSRTRVKDDQFTSVSGMALLEQQDYDSLFAIVMRGRLTSIDSSDLGVKCPSGQGEIMQLVLKRSDEPRALNLFFDECAAEYNLLLEPSRSAFSDLVRWFIRIRDKYRPYEP